MMNNLTLEECLQENFGKNVLDCTGCHKLSERKPWELLVHATLIGIIIIASLVGNLLVLILVLKYKLLRRQRTALITLSNIVTNTILIFSFHLPAFVSALSGKWVFSFPGCQAFGFLSSEFIMLRFFTMGVLALDRFFTVRYPFTYPKYEKRFIISLLSACWIFSTLSSIATVDGYASVAFRQNIPSCLFYTPGIGKGIIFFSFITILSYGFGAILPTVIYIWLFFHARRHRISIGRLHNRNGSVITTAGDVHSRELRPFITFALIFFVFFVTGLPSSFMQLLRSFSLETFCSTPPLMHFAGIILYLSSTALDPVLIMRDRDYRKRLKHLICCHNNCGRYYNDRSNIYPEIPRERDFDAVRTMAMRALVLVAPQSSGSSNTSLSSTDSVVRPHRPRSGSAPPSFFTGRRPSTVAIIPDTINEVEAETEIEEEGGNTMETGMQRKTTFIRQKNGTIRMEVEGYEEPTVSSNDSDNM